MEERNEVEILRASNIKQVEDEGGRPRVVFNEPEFLTRTFDRVIDALGGTTPTNFLRTLGIAFNDQAPVFDKAGATNVPAFTCRKRLSNRTHLPRQREPEQCYEREALCSGVRPPSR